VSIQFLPQGIAICFYGSTRIILGVYLSLRRFWKTGSGFNEYDSSEKQIRIFRWGFPGKERCFKFFCSFSEIESLRLETQSSIIRSNLYLVLKKQRKILLTQLGSMEFRSLQEVEYFSSNLARFLNVPLKREENK